MGFYAKFSKLHTADSALATGKTNDEIATTGQTSGTGMTVGLYDGAGSSTSGSAIKMQSGTAEDPRTQAGSGRVGVSQQQPVASNPHSGPSRAPKQLPSPVPPSAVGSSTHPDCFRKPHHRPLPKLLPLAPKLPLVQHGSYAGPQISSIAQLKKKEKKKPKPKSKVSATSSLPPMKTAKVSVEKHTQTSGTVKKTAQSSIVPIAPVKDSTMQASTPESLSEPSTEMPGTPTTGSDPSLVPSSSRTILPQVEDLELNPSISTHAANVAPTLLPIDVETNPDYVALTCALSLLQAQRAVTFNDLISLKKQKADALGNPALFINALRRTGGLEDIPKMQTITRAPRVSWKKYGIEASVLEHHLSRGLVDRQPVASPITLFDDLTR